MAVLTQMVDGVAAQKFDLGDLLSIGRLPQNDVMIDDTSVSSQHAVIERKTNPDFPDVIEFYVRDLGSTNGTYVNGEQISSPTLLHHQDEIKVAWNVFKFLDENTLNLSKTVHIVE